MTFGYIITQWESHLLRSGTVCVCDTGWKWACFRLGHDKRQCVSTARAVILQKLVPRRQLDILSLDIFSSEYWSVALLAGGNTKQPCRGKKWLQKGGWGDTELVTVPSGGFDFSRWRWFLWQDEVYMLMMLMSENSRRLVILTAFCTFKCSLIVDI